VLQDERLWIGTTDVTRAALSDDASRAICQSVMLPYFQRQAYVPGIKAGLSRITETLREGLRPAWERRLIRKAETGKTVVAYLLTFFLVSWLLIIGHELSHTIVAQLAGLRVYRVTIGSGKLIGEFRLGRINFEFKRYFEGGLTALGTPQGYDSRLGIWLLTAAGPAFHLAVLILLHLAYQRTDFTQTLQTYAYLTIFFNVLYWRNLFDLALNLMPYTYREKAFEHKTDGYQLWRIPFYTQKDFDDYRKSALALEWLEPFRANRIQEALALMGQGRAEFPEAAVFELGEASTLLHVGAYDQALTTMRAALQREDVMKDNVMRVWANNDVAYALAILNRPEFFAEADECSQAALKDPFDRGPIIGTRGAVLLRLGKIEEGIELLKESLAEETSPRDRAENTCWLAIAYALQNDFTHAHQSLAEARRSKVIPYFYQQAEAEVAALYEATRPKPMTRLPEALKLAA
jgi:tetratricopeptide (TPR) repeat protein